MNVVIIELISLVAVLNHHVKSFKKFEQKQKLKQKKFLLFAIINCIYCYAKFFSSNLKNNCIEISIAFA